MLYEFNMILSLWITFSVLGYARKYPPSHPLMDDNGNPVINARWAWLGIPRIFLKFCEFWSEFQQNLSKSCKIWILQEFESAGFGILHELLLSFLEILKFLGKVCSINFEPPDNDLCSTCHVYPIFRRAWIISIPFIVNRFNWGLHWKKSVCSRLC